MGDRDRQKNGDKGSVATASQPVAVALQQLLCGIAAAVAMQQAMASGTGSQWWGFPVSDHIKQLMVVTAGSGRPLQQVIVSNKLILETATARMITALYESRTRIVITASCQQ